MSASSIEELVAEWELDPATPPEDQVRYREMLDGLCFAEAAFNEYVPAQSAGFSPSYFDRLLRWLCNDGLSPADQRLAFELANRLTYFSRADFIALYRNAFTGPISKWVMQQAGITLDQPNWAALLEAERMQRTWYCGITDSMQISEFYHVNYIAGISQRPGFRSLKQFQANPELISGYMDEEGLKRIVLLEDFVCTGQQSAGVVEWAAASIKKPILFVPLIAGPDGIRRLKGLNQNFSPASLEVNPLVILSENDFVMKNRGPTDSQALAIHKMLIRIHSFVLGDVPNAPNIPPYSPLGYSLPGDRYSGAMALQCSNCPDNALPAVHFHSSKSSWAPLFPRIEREG